MCVAILLHIAKMCKKFFSIFSQPDFLCMGRTKSRVYFTWYGSSELLGRISGGKIPWTETQSI